MKTTIRTLKSQLKAAYWGSIGTVLPLLLMGL